MRPRASSRSRRFVVPPLDTIIERRQRGWCQLVWLAGAAQCGENDEIAAGQPVRLEDPVHRLVDQCGDA